MIKFFKILKLNTLAIGFEIKLNVKAWNKKRKREKRIDKFFKNSDNQLRRWNEQ